NVYLHVQDSQLTTLELPPIPAHVEYARLLGDGTPVPFTQDAARLRFTLPVPGRDPADTIVTLKLDPAATATVHSGVAEAAFGDTVAYGEVVLVKTNVTLSGGEVELDLGKTRKVTGVVVEPALRSLPLVLSLSFDRQKWNQVAVTKQAP